MSRYITEALRKLVAKRAKHRCEYCRIFAIYSFLSFHIEHIISVKHGGKSIAENLAYSCPICNFNKGSDIATFVDSIRVPIRFYNPRIDNWDNHFEVEATGLILSKTDIGKATIKIFNFNHPDSIIERQILIVNDFF